MGHYITNVRDIEFNLVRGAATGQTCSTPAAYGDLDADTVRTMLDEVARLAEGPVAESFAAGRPQPACLRSGDAHHHGARRTGRWVQAVKDAEWWRMGVAEEIGGSPPPPPGVGRRRNAGRPRPFGGFLVGPRQAIANALYVEGNDSRSVGRPSVLERGWAATMVLTEPDAGSDVGAGRAKAIAQPDGTWHIEGVKRFISGGDIGDTAENIFHLVLARPEGPARAPRG